MGRKKLYRTPEELREHQRIYFKTYSKTYYEANREKKIAIAKAFYLANKDKVKDRMKIYSKIYYKANKDKVEVLAKRKVYYEINRDKQIAYTKAYRKANRDKVNTQRNKNRNNRMKTDIQFKLSRVLRRRLYKALHGNYKNGSAVKDLGCTIDELKTHLESKFQSGMTWDNWSLKGWHIDHIKPLASFDLTDREQLLIACHYTNLQPLWAKDNLIKSAKIISYNV
jgi:hypothetical protein